MIPAHSNNIELYTPSSIFEGLPIDFDLDPCSPVAGPVTPAKKHYTKLEDGLAQPWHGVVWLNPPYQRFEIGKWIAKLREHGQGVALVYARTDTKWFHDNLPDTILFLKGRVNFYQKEGAAGSHSPVMLLGYGSRCDQALRFSSLRGQLFNLCSKNYDVQRRLEE